MREQLEQQLARFEELEKMLLDPAVLANGAKMALVAREHGSLAKVAGKYRRFKQLNGQIADAVALAAGGDADMRELAEAELPELRSQREALWNELLDLTIGGEDANRTRCVVEIRAGTGGDEAALFARDLYEMYRHFSEDKGWKVEILDMSPTELGGFKEVILGVQGEGVYRELQYESGGHRVQRVPETEAKGRIHTSAATVAVLGEPEEVEVDIKDSDIRMDFYRSSGPGGQNVNKTSSAVRLTHLPTGIVVAIQEESSQHKNRAKAMRVLRSRIYAKAQEERIEREQAKRRSQVGSGDRSQRIRTYNFPQNRCTDHRLGENFSLERVIEGQLDAIVDALRAREREQRLKEL